MSPWFCGLSASPLGRPVPPRCVLCPGLGCRRSAGALRGSGGLGWPFGITGLTLRVLRSLLGSFSALIHLTLGVLAFSLGSSSVSLQTRLHLDNNFFFPIAGAILMYHRSLQNTEEARNSPRPPRVHTLGCILVSLSLAHLDGVAMTDGPLRLPVQVSSLSFHVTPVFRCGTLAGAPRWPSRGLDVSSGAPASSTPC